MIIGGSKLKIELQEVFETSLAYRVLEQTLPRTIEPYEVSDETK